MKQECQIWQRIKTKFWGKVAESVKKVAEEIVGQNIDRMPDDKWYYQKQ